MNENTDDQGARLAGMLPAKRPLSGKQHPVSKKPSGNIIGNATPKPFPNGWTQPSGYNIGNATPKPLPNGCTQPSGNNIGNATPKPVPNGWTRKTFTRKSGTMKGKKYSMWYSPEGKAFRSLKSIKYA